MRPGHEAGWPLQGVAKSTLFECDVPCAEGWPSLGRRIPGLGSGQDRTLPEACVLFQASVPRPAVVTSSTAADGSAHEIPVHSLKPSAPLGRSSALFPGCLIKSRRPEITNSHPMRWGVALGYRHSPGLARGHSVIEVDMLDPCFHLDPEEEGFAGMPFRLVLVHHDDLFREVVRRCSVYCVHTVT